MIIQPFSPGGKRAIEGGAGATTGEGAVTGSTGAGAVAEGGATVEGGVADAGGVAAGEGRESPAMGGVQAANTTRVKFRQPVPRDYDASWCPQ